MGQSDELPDEFWRGIDEFNAGAFYDCHDTLEAIWLECYGAEKKFYQGILQIAVACYHLSNLNWRGCAILLGEGMSRLRPYPADYGGIDVAGLLAKSDEMLMIVQQASTLGDEAVEQVARDYGLVLGAGSGANAGAATPARRSRPCIDRVSA